MKQKHLVAAKRVSRIEKLQGQVEKWKQVVLSQGREFCTLIKG